jgi:hypothetical protein
LKKLRLLIGQDIAQYATEGCRNDTNESGWQKRRSHFQRDPDTKAIVKTLT